MEIRRFFINPNDFDGETAVISGDEFAHAKVLRQKVGFTIIFCLGDGYDYYAEITEIKKDRLIAKYIKKIKNNTATNHKITLYQGSLKCGKNDFVVQKAVELGISEVCFFVSKNTVETKISLERLKRISIEASKQCGRSDIANVRILTFNEVLGDIKQKSTLLFYENEKNNTLNNTAFDKFSNDVAIIIGSEGGFDKNEIKKAKAENIKTMSLGSRILRAETASVVATAIVMYKLGELNESSSF